MHPIEKLHVESNDSRLNNEDYNDTNVIKHLRRYEFAKQFTKGNSFLDLACGTGYGTRIMNENLKNLVQIGGELSINALPKNDNKFVNLNCHNLPFKNNSFGCIVSFETIEHLPNPKQFLKETYRCLTPKGKLIVSTPNKIFTSFLRKKPLTKFHFDEWTLKGYTQLLNSTYNSIEWYCQGPITQPWLYAAENWLYWQRTLKKARVSNQIYKLIKRISPHKSVTPSLKWNNCDLKDFYKVVKMNSNTTPLVFVAVCSK